MIWSFNMKKLDLILISIYNKSQNADNDYDVLLYNIRKRNVDEIDCLELALAKNRCNVLNEVLTDILKIIGDL